MLKDNFLELVGNTPLQQLRGEKIFAFAILSGAKRLRQRSEIKNLNFAALRSGCQKAY